jgi:hypothetical protein
MNECRCRGCCWGGSRNCPGDQSVRCPCQSGSERLSQHSSTAARTPGRARERRFSRYELPIFDKLQGACVLHQVRECTAIASRYGSRAVQGNLDSRLTPNKRGLRTGDEPRFHRRPGVQVRRDSEFGLLRDIENLPNVWADFDRTEAGVAARRQPLCRVEPGTVAFREPVDGISLTLGLLSSRALFSWETLEDTSGSGSCQCSEVWVTAVAATACGGLICSKPAAPAGARRPSLSEVLSRIRGGPACRTQKKPELAAS